ncbi:MAG TPA: hypothetical protein VL283_02500 [Candidatus Baltobacteraceae bacterium]|nr:hypothetical protein [Candidatus Baltobacteraceae bacterium]
MANLLKAFALFTFGFVILANLGDALEKKKGAAATSETSDAPFTAEAEASAITQEESDLVEEPPPVAKPVAKDGTYAQVCARFDPVAHPEHVIDILEYASDTTGTPVDILYSVWQKETGYLDGAGRLSGGCNMMDELVNHRDRDAGTHHAQSMLAMADSFGWKQQYGERLERMTCSCPGHDKATGERKGYGGCCGPFQFSGAEVDDEYAIPYGLDPMTFCGGALIAGWELKKHHDGAFTSRRNRQGQVVPGRGESILARNPGYTREQAAWQAAMSRYYGGDAGGVYGNTAIAKWKQFHAWYQQDLTQPGYLVGKILGLGNTQYSLRKLRATRLTYASN